MTDNEFQLLIEVWIGLGVLVFIALQFIAAPYGRYISSKWGPTMPNKAGWVVMELPALLICPVIFFLGDGDKNDYLYFFVALWLLHYTHRTLIFPFKTQSTGKQIPIVTVLFGIIFNLMNGMICGYYFGHLSPYYPDDYFTQEVFIIGFIGFFAGMVVNISSDYKLISLRNNSSAQNYQIPQGGLFNYISSPNLVGEIIQWCSFALMVFALPAVSFAVWTIANLLPRVFRNHRWYQQQFDDYPKERKALIPFVL